MSRRTEIFTSLLINYLRNHKIHRFESKQVNNQYYQTNSEERVAGTSDTIIHNLIASTSEAPKELVHYLHGDSLLSELMT